ncbi:SpoIIE family protein phosphatase [Sorangium sp. So ce136]|uniref:SpoIIE family protein phosphatase n=1 Tax=Sorangium sp. So ce136 TaxID=3133284 RepID=UPI003F079427
MSDAQSPQDPRKGPELSGVFARFKKFNTKFLLVTGFSVLIGALLNVVIARQGMHTLSGKSAYEIESGLNAANREYLTNHLADKAQHTNFVLGQAYADLEILSGIAQTMIDRGDELKPLFEKAASMPFFHDDLVYNPEGNWYQNRPDEPTGVAVWGYLGNKGTILPEVQASVDDTSLLNLVLPAFKKYGSDKLQVYYVGPHTAPYVRVAPWADMGSSFDKLYPGHNEKNWYDFFFPNLVESWGKWIKDPEQLKKLKSTITVLAPYEDSAGGGMVITAFHPLWNKERTAFAGATALDLTLGQLIESIKDVRLAQSGFAFLVQSDGNVLAINEAGAGVLRLRSDSGQGQKSEGVAALQRHLKDSSEPAVAALSLPQNESIDYHEISIGGEAHIIALQQLAGVNGWKGPGADIARENWTLAFVVPKKELYASLVAAQAAIEQSRTSIVTQQVVATIASLLVLMLGVYLVSRRMTGTLVALSSGATRMREGDYGVRIEVNSADEIGQLGVAFNEMASEIEAYTNNLEELVGERTRALEKANEEISELNAKLAQENIRLGAELNVARQLQLMVLPAPSELQEIPGLDIAGYMAPADEVGGDYYDVLRSDGLVKIGIGDVTGHGLESGVLMLMVQTAVRTLLAANEKDPKKFLSIVNKVIYQNIQRIRSDKNLSLTLLDYSDGKLQLTGQHEDLIIVRKDGTLDRVETMGLGLPIGIDLDISEFIGSIEVALEAGDVVTLFSDGITEAEDSSEEQYGIDRLCQVISRNHERNSKEIKDAIIEDVLAHVGYNKIHDDITVLVIKRV